MLLCLESLSVCNYLEERQASKQKQRDLKRWRESGRAEQRETERERERKAERESWGDRGEREKDMYLQHMYLVMISSL